MAEDTYTEVTRTSWGGRLGGAIGGVVVGLIMFAAAFPLLYWNEGRSIKTYKSLQEGSGIVVAVNADNVNPANNSKLVHLTGEATTDETLQDDDFAIKSQAVKLRRVVEMYQWEEEKQTESREKVGGSTENVTTYKYHTTWSENLIDSSNFKQSAGHQNPSSKAFATKEWTAKRVTLGKFTLSSSLVNKMDDYSPLAVEAGSKEPRLSGREIHIEGGGYYIGRNPQMPAVGDLRISFKAVKPQVISIVAKQVNSTFEPYYTKAGGEIELLQTGMQSAENMFKKAEQENRIMTWVLRLVGFLLMFFGLMLIFKPLSVTASVLPFLGSIVQMGTGLVSFFIAAICSLITIGVSWLAVRPLIGVPFLMGAIACLVWAIRWLPKRRAARMRPAAGA